ncbi:MAG: YfcE family phosphodiesterase [Clostridiales bacterium]|nr:YfcE family phosphodiesterase [Candidatus Cacconaster stercorequi]
MRILVLSDSHGAVDNMTRCVEMTEPRHILFLGDCLRDADKLHQRFPDIPMDTVPGNCDWGSTDEPERLIELGGKRILMMHGHTRSVKYSAMNAYYAAREMGADILLFGHTHRPVVDFDGTVYTMNPGSVGDRYTPTYGIITINDKTFDCATYRL